MNAGLLPGFFVSRNYPSKNFIGLNEKITEMLKQVQHDVLSLFAILLRMSPSAKPTKWCLRQIPTEELVSGSTFKSVIGSAHPFYW